MMLLVGSDAERLERLRAVLRKHSFPCFACVYTELSRFPLMEEVDVLVFCQMPSAPLVQLYLSPIRRAYPEIKTVAWFDGTLDPKELEGSHIYDESFTYKPRHIFHFVDAVRQAYYVYPRYCKNRYFSRHALSDILYRTMIELAPMTPAVSTFLALLIRYKDGVSIDVVRYSCFKAPEEVTKNNVHNLVSRLNFALDYPAARWDSAKNKYILR